MSTYYSSNNSFTDRNCFSLIYKPIKEDDYVDMFDDEEELEEYLDSLSRPKKRNNRKQLLSMFVYKILVENTSPEKHISQKQIIDMLKEEPYELTIERKALGRVIHGLEDEFMGVHSDNKTGVWYDENDDEILLKH